MTVKTIDTLSRLLAQRPSRRVLLPGLGGLLATPFIGGTGLHASKKRKKKKSALCFNGETVQAAKKAKKKLLKKGATPGACASSPPPPPPPPPPGECTPACEAKGCGMDDGCGGVCGCPEGSVCHEGTCHTCTVVCDGDAAACGQSLRAAMVAGGMIVACPGRYLGGFEVLNEDVLLIGAGEGDDPARDTILDANGNGRPVTILPGRTAELHRLRVTGAKTTSNGGGIRSEGSLTLTNCTITKNVATGRRGGGIYHHEDATGNLTLNGCTVSGNTAESGGGIANYGTRTVLLNDSTVSGNKSITHGGGIDGSGALTLNGTAVSGNEAITEGGGIYNRVGGALRLDAASRVSGNVATGSGGGIYVDSGAVTISGARITGNRSIAGTGGGIHKHGGVVSLNNAEVSENEPDDCAGLTC